MSNLSDMITEASVIRTEVEKNSEYNLKIKKNIKNLNERIAKAKENGRTSTCFTADSDVEYEIRKMYIEKGYSFKPTGYIAGVWQLTEDICW